MTLWTLWLDSVAAQCDAIWSLLLPDLSLKNVSEHREVESSKPEVESEEVQSVPERAQIFRSCNYYRRREGRPGKDRVRYGVAET